MNLTQRKGRLTRITAGGSALDEESGCGLGVMMAPAALSAPVGAGFQLDDSDLRFILKQIQISETHASTEGPGGLGSITPATSVLGPGEFDLPSPLVPWGLRETAGRNNNLFAGRETWGAADQLFPDMSSIRRWRATESPSPFGPVATTRTEPGTSRTPHRARSAT